jgi:hypothetical protein
MTADAVAEELGAINAKYLHVDARVSAPVIGA